MKPRTALIVLTAVVAVPAAVVWGWMTGSGVVASTAFALLSSVGMVWFMGAAQKRIAKNPPEFPGERVIFQSPANHFRGAEGVGGWLVLTDERLVFRPHKLNVQRGEWSLTTEDIERLEPRSTAWIVANGLRAVTKNGEERFVVDDRDRWVEEFRSFQESAR